MTGISQAKASALSEAEKRAKEYWDAADDAEHRAFLEIVADEFEKELEDRFGDGWVEASLEGPARPELTLFEDAIATIRGGGV